MNISTDEQTVNKARLNKDSAEWLAFCATKWVDEHLDYYTGGEYSAENVVEELFELRTLLEELEAAIKTAAVRR